MRVAIWDYSESIDYYYCLCFQGLKPSRMGDALSGQGVEYIKLLRINSRDPKLCFSIGFREGIYYFINIFTNSQVYLEFVETRGISPLPAQLPNALLDTFFLKGISQAIINIV